jgi:protein-tyrosine phosphatase
MTTVDGMSQEESYHILFVCMGNICRSPSGENVMRKVVGAAGLAEKFHLDSAGTISLHTGDPPDARMCRSLANRGFATAGRARQVKPGDFESFDLILAMDEDNLTDLRGVESRASNSRAHLQLFCDFCREHDDREVPDPYYGGAEGFERVIDLLEDGCQGILEKWQGKKLPGQ